jgi:membrane protein YqaA with SNARE-associated domain
MKKIYNWILNWANSPYASIALFIMGFIESIFFPVPADILLIVLVLGYRKKAFKYALYCTLGSVSGALIGYSLGHFLWVDSIGEFTWFANLFFNNIPGFSAEMFYRIKEMFLDWDFWIIIIAGLTPIPFKVFTISAGVLDQNLFIFILASLISRGTRYFLLTFLLWKYGSPIKAFIDRYFNVIALSFSVCVVGFILIIKFVFKS